tara:strand:- start:334 stop:741 length:408 start_codon:yes stop_codon:yes gene_type:complete
MVSSVTSAIDQFGSVAFSGGGQKYAFKSLGDDGELVAAATGMKIRVLSVYASCNDTNELVNVYLEDGTTQIGAKFLAGALTTGSEHSFQMPPFVLPFSPTGWCETTSGAALNAEFSAALTGGKVEFMIVYDEVAG